MKKILVTICAALGFALIPANAQVITSVENAFIDEGWSFWWNPNGYAVAGQAPFEQLVLTSSAYPGVIYGASSTFPSPDLKAGALYIGYPADDGRVGGLTGTGSADGQGEGVPRIPRASIWGFTVATSGVFEIQNLSFQFEGSSLDGVYFNVFLGTSTEDIFGQGIAAGHSSLNVSSINLGFVSAGDIIYVSVAPNGNNTSDGYFIDYDIVAVPEPSSVVLLGAGLLGLGLMALRKRNSQIA